MDNKLRNRNWNWVNQGKNVSLRGLLDDWLLHQGGLSSSSSTVIYERDFVQSQRKSLTHNGQWQGPRQGLDRRGEDEESRITKERRGGSSGEMAEDPLTVINSANSVYLLFMEWFSFQKKWIKFFNYRKTLSRK